MKTDRAAPGSAGASPAAFGVSPNASVLPRRESRYTPYIQKSPIYRDLSPTPVTKPACFQKLPEFSIITAKKLRATNSSQVIAITLSNAFACVVQKLETSLNSRRKYLISPFFTLNPRNVIFPLALFIFALYRKRPVRVNSCPFVVAPRSTYVDCIASEDTHSDPIVSPFFVLYRLFEIFCKSIKRMPKNSFFLGIWNLVFGHSSRTVCRSMNSTENSRKLRWIRFNLAVVTFGLFISGATAIPLVPEADFLHRLVNKYEILGPTREWVQTVYAAILDTNSRYHFMFYGTDWLAFGHFVIAIAFVGPMRDPVRNKWIIDFGIIACLLIVPYALIFGQVRGIPVWWRLIDCAFGIFGIIPLYLARHATIQLERATSTPAAT